MGSSFYIFKKGCKQKMKADEKKDYADKIHAIIDEAMAARDRSVSLYISPDGGISVSFFPWPDEETLREMYDQGKISCNDYQMRLGLPLIAPIKGDKYND